MGQSIAAALERQEDLELAGIWRRGDDIDALVRKSDVIIDFSLPEATDMVLDGVRRARKPLVCGVSGLAPAQLQSLTEAAASIPVVYDRNMSLGVAILQRSVSMAAAALGSEFGVQINEVHHIHKQDAPSGTALKLAEAIAAVRGQTGTGTAEFHSERVGEVPGDHEVIMTSATERLVFSHSVTTRQVFADGAIVAARWVADRPAGWYSMQDVLFVTDQKFNTKK